MKVEAVYTSKENIIEPNVLFAYQFYCKGCDSLHAFYVNKKIQKLEWSFNNNVNKPTFSPSLVNKWNNNVCHLFVKNGKIEYQNDCTHKLAGQTIEMEDIE